ncbi:MAG: hypothetical protein RIT27_960 [Pseudomonadota bacterium]|jgi:hypothetical protein
MPYFIYKIFAGKKLEKVSSFPKFFDAKQQAKTLRAALSSDEQYQIKIIFAQHETEAEMLLKEEREYQPDGND